MIDKTAVVVLVAVRSRHGATLEIAQYLGDQLAARGVTAIVSDAADVTTFDGYDAIVIGSAVYLGKWLRSAREFLEEAVALAAGRPLWLLSSGPLDTEEPPSDAVSGDVAPFIGARNVRGHREFAGRLDPRTLGPIERLTLPEGAAAEGDYRNWTEIALWAAEIVAVLLDETSELRQPAPRAAHATVTPIKQTAGR